VRDWIVRCIEEHGIDRCLTAFACTPEELSAAERGDPAMVYELGVKRNAAARKVLGTKTGQGRPAGTLTLEERLALVRLLDSDPRAVPREMTEQTLARAVLGRRVAAHSLMAIRDLLGQAAA
jgi:hypothetical protein